MRNKLYSAVDESETELNNKRCKVGNDGSEGDSNKNMTFSTSSHLFAERQVREPEQEVMSEVIVVALNEFVKFLNIICFGAISKVFQATVCSLLVEGGNEYRFGS